MNNLNIRKCSKSFLSVVVGLILVSPIQSLSQIGIWTSPTELADVPMSGPAWDAVQSAADLVDPNNATVSDNDSNNNADILAAAIVYARSGMQSYRDKVVTALEKLVSEGIPGNHTLSWSRESGAYVMAADLIGYRTTAFEDWCRNMAEVWIASDGRTMLEMFKRRPNNWGSMALGSLSAIYVYLGDSARLNEIRDHWIQLVLGPKPDEASYGSDLTWHIDETNPRVINPQGSIKNGLNIDGVIPDDMRRGGSFANPPATTGYVWGYLQGLVTGARVLDRVGMQIWDVGNNAIYRAVYCLQVRYEQAFGGWAAAGDDEWLMPFLDEVYGTTWTAAYDPLNSEIWEHGKIAGWGYVTLGGAGSGTTPNAPTNLLSSAASGSRIDLIWTDNSPDESGFRIERSEDGGAVFSEIALIGSNVTNYSDNGLAALTEHCYRIRAYNSAGNSDFTNTSCATTLEPNPVDDVPNGETAVAGTVNNNYVATQSSDNLYESIEERESGGKPSNRYSYLEHKWIINVTGGTAVTFFLEAFKTSSSDGDDFVFAFSIDDENYTDMLTVTKLADDHNYQVFSLPNWLSGTVYLRVQDTDRSSDNKAMDTIYIDHMFVHSEPGQPTLPSAPADLTAAPFSAGQINLAWTDNASDELGFNIERSEDSGITYTQIASTNADVTNYSDTDLSTATEYCYRVAAYSMVGNSGYSNAACATTPSSGGPSDNVPHGETAVAGTVSGSYVDTRIADDVYESIEERESSGKPSERYSYLEHKWIINVTGESVVTFFLEAFKTSSSDGDDFVFAYSTDDENYTDMLTLSKLADDDTYQLFTLPSSLSGTLYIRAVDSDRTTGNRAQDIVYIDRMFVRSEAAVGKRATPLPEAHEAEVPEGFSLHQNNPNPFNPSTAIEFALPQAGDVSLKIYNLRGQLVTTLHQGAIAAGRHQLAWDGKDGRGQQVATGVYFYRLEADGFVATKKLTLMK